MKNLCLYCKTNVYLYACKVGSQVLANVENVFKNYKIQIKD